MTTLFSPDKDSHSKFNELWGIIVGYQAVGKQTLMAGVTARNVCVDVHICTTMLLLAFMLCGKQWLQVQSILLQILLPAHTASMLGLSDA